MKTVFSWHEISVNYEDQNELKYISHWKPRLLLYGLKFGLSIIFANVQKHTFRKKNSFFSCLGSLKQI